MLILALIFFFPILNRLRHLARGKHEPGRLAVDTHSRPQQAGVADLQLKPRRLTDDAHVGHYAVVHQVARADAGAPVALTLKPADLRLFDFTDDTGDDDVALEFYPGSLNRRHRFDVTRKSRFHVDQAAAVNALVLDHRFLRIVEVIHMRIEHQRGAAAGPFQSADYVGPALFDLLIFDLHAQLLKLAAEILGNSLLFAGDTDDVG